MQYVTGLDLGQAQDPTALAVVELSPCAHPGRPGRLAWRHTVLALKQWPLGTLYPQIVADVAGSVAARVPGGPLVVDQTGVGRPVVDFFRQTTAAHRIVPVTITSGTVAVEEEAGWRVPKKDLVGVLQALMQQRRLKVAVKCRESDTLKKELQNFRVKITAAANETFGAWREGQHDDLVLALALACWYAERRPCGDVAPQPGGRCLAAKAPEGVFAGQVG